MFTPTMIFRNDAVTVSFVGRTPVMFIWNVGFEVIDPMFMVCVVELKIKTPVGQGSPLDKTAV